MGDPHSRFTSPLMGSAPVMTICRPCQCHRMAPSAPQGRRGLPQLQTCPGMGEGAREEEAPSCRRGGGARQQTLQIPIVHSTAGRLLRCIWKKGDIEFTALHAWQHRPSEEASKVSIARDGEEYYRLSLEGRNCN